MRQSAMHERYPGLNLFNSRHTAQLDRRCPRITPPTRHLTRADLARRSATILASEPPPEVILGLVTTFQRLRSTSGVPNAPRPQLYGRRTQEPLPKARSPWAKLSPARAQERLFVFRERVSLVLKPVRAYEAGVHPLSNGAAPPPGPALAKKGASVSV